MKKLISMTDFVLERNNLLKNAPDAYEQYWKIVEYARFLKAPLTLGMFVPCDDDGNVLEPYTKTKSEQSADAINGCRFISKEESKWNKAQSKVIFNDCTVIVHSNHYVFYYKNHPIFGSTIEDLIKFNIEYNDHNK